MDVTQINLRLQATLPLKTSKGIVYNILVNVVLLLLGSCISLTEAAQQETVERGTACMEEKDLSRKLNTEPVCMWYQVNHWSALECQFNANVGDGHVQVFLRVV